MDERLSGAYHELKEILDKQRSLLQRWTAVKDIRAIAATVPGLGDALHSTLHAKDLEFRAELQEIAQLHIRSDHLKFAAKLAAPKAVAEGQTKGYKDGVTSPANDGNSGDSSKEGRGAQAPSEDCPVPLWNADESTVNGHELTANASEAMPNDETDMTAKAPTSKSPTASSSVSRVMSSGMNGYNKASVKTQPLAKISFKECRKVIKKMAARRRGRIGSMQCLHCDYSTSSRTKFLDHMLRHLPHCHFPYKCPESACEFAAVCISELQSHFLLVHKREWTAKTEAQAQQKENQHLMAEWYFLLARK